MNLFLLNILLALLWGFINGSFETLTLASGFALGYLVILVARPAFGPSRYYTGLWHGFAFALFYVWELINSSFRVAYDVVTPRFHGSPAIIKYPLICSSDIEITLLSSLISLTPGTLSLDLSPDRKILYIHVLYGGDDPEAVRTEIREQLEQRVIRLFR
jgi:multicomponent Na+:H+ antiporter subunit E